MQICCLMVSTKIQRLFCGGTILKILLVRVGRFAIGAKSKITVVCLVSKALDTA